MKSIQIISPSSDIFEISYFPGVMRTSGYLLA